MAHLLQLELKKFGILRNILFTGGAVLFMILFITVSLVDSVTDPQQTKDSFESTFLVIGLLTMTIFLVYGSVLTVQMVITEYNQRTITILFAYPISRKQLIGAKLAIVEGYTLLSMTAAYLCTCGYIVAVDRAFDLLGGSFHLSLLKTWIPTGLVSVLVCGVLSLWPFVIGMMKKSVPATIITSLFTVLIRQLLISQNDVYRESPFQICLAVLITVGATWWTFRTNVLKIYE